jgi:hypothetical protein
MADENPKRDLDPNDNTEKDPDDWVSGGDPMTGAQASYLNTAFGAGLWAGGLCAEPDEGRGEQADRRAEAADQGGPQTECAVIF